MSPADSPTPSDSGWLTRTVGIVFDRRTYRHLLYLLLAFPLGLIYYLFVGFGLTFGLVLSVVVVGVVVLAATIGLVRLFAELERRLANVLLSTTLGPAEDVDSTGSGILAIVTRYVDAPSTWRGLSFVTMKLWTGIVGLVLIVALISAIQIATAPLHYPHRVEFGTLNGEPIAWTIQTLPEAALAVPIGGLLVLVCLHVTNAVAYVCARIAEALLGSGEHL
ncbi:sensor domain-containing protein [Natranaeroarchaeum sulfidigenes]|uniref:Histidine kinase, HisKA_3 family n=1 Tax=Natranaeroarchaeum sulfidigenes TaxID=2784880 RepID=A0A897MXR1_9EURY|nr:sensor domain-containing protein [Natranaeroarchaeum sulfidigenes]QSG03115.1 Histidine kinase, HisKA_3 family [Natranaeroarchaeum sulfidigenes]